MPVPEREAVDEALSRARSRLAGDPVPQNMGAATKVLCQTLVDCTEAIVRQIRDADDTVATQIRPTIETGLADIGVIFGNNLSAIHSVVDQIRRDME